MAHIKACPAARERGTEEGGRRGEGAKEREESIRAKKEEGREKELLKQLGREGRRGGKGVKKMSRDVHRR